MDFRKPGNIVYRYQMEGFDKGYIFSANTYEATYTNLDPGEYRFIVQASFKNGVWGKKVRSLLVIVVPPWYKTWWFYTLAVSSTISFTYLVYRERLLQLARLNKLRNRIARDLHDEVGSSVSSIAIYSKIVHDHINNTTFDNEPLLKKIADYATEIMNSMNDIVWNINTKNDAFEHIINRMREHAYQLFEAKGYSLHFEFDENLKRSKLSMENRREFYLIYKEALNNVAKYANGKTVWITLTLNQKLISLTIKDDGQGFDLANLKKGGNGLANMRFRAASLKGKITIISSPSEGTEIQLKFLA
jgi:signal transduction histidine kinase